MTGSPFWKAVPKLAAPVVSAATTVVFGRECRCNPSSMPHNNPPPPTL
eukprot:CAMPEP_0171315774 /NCGR_PEP_ID=MMETSP0816-20121228/67070_1 /TAXON_ID=420281 /ORGANISM="Proboscia inermis, Strain CCAP1064/1" /LENGTH=47 /DNA_ID= /DNA_START= /DNA_END= /DNA_ORIENTATION=